MTYSGEINFDGLIGPTHNYAGLSQGNLASQKHLNQTSNPQACLLYTSPSPRDGLLSRMPSSA